MHKSREWCGPVPVLDRNHHVQSGCDLHGDSLNRWRSYHDLRRGSGVFVHSLNRWELLVAAESVATATDDAADAAAAALPAWPGALAANPSSATHASHAAAVSPSATHAALPTCPSLSRRRFN